MKCFPVKILSIEQIAKDINRIKINKPKGYKFIPGQATDVSINTPKLKDQKRPFTFTGLPEWDELEFIIKSYETRNGVTKKIRGLKPNDELLIGNPWGTINYKGQGLFIAAGTGITPFISIFRDLKRRNRLPGNSLVYCNKTVEDIILKDELEVMFGNEVNFLLSKEENHSYYHGRIDELYLSMIITDFARDFYVCGPESFVKDITLILKNFGAQIDSIIFEK